MICLSVKQSACAISILLLLKLTVRCFWGLGASAIGPASEIPIEVELLLELQGLVARVRLPAALPLCDGEGQSIIQETHMLDMLVGWRINLTP